MIRIPPSIELPEDEIRFTYARSSGPGGQNVNKVSTQATLHFDVDGSPSLTTDQKRRIRRQLAGRIGRTGVLHVVSRRHRTQPANRRAALERFIELMTEALRPRKARRPTRPSRAAREKRLADKAKRSATKRLRQDRPSADG
jgi:ribosome-associated protein